MTQPYKWQEGIELSCLSQCESPSFARLVTDPAVGILFGLGGFLYGEVSNKLLFQLVGCRGRSEACEVGGEFDIQALSLC